MKRMSKQGTKILGVRITTRLADLMDKFIELDTHMSKSEFTRAAIREKLTRDAPQLTKKIFDGEY